MQIDYLSNPNLWLVDCNIDLDRRQLLAGLLLINPRSRLQPGQRQRLFEPGKPNGIWLEIKLGNEYGSRIQLPILDYYLGQTTALQSKNNQADGGPN